MTLFYFLPETNSGSKLLPTVSGIQRISSQASNCSWSDTKLMYCSQLLEMLKCTITSHLFLIEIHWLISEKVVLNMRLRLALQTCENCPSEITQASMRRWKSNDHCTEKRLEGSELAAGCPLILSVDYPYLELHPQLWIQPDPQHWSPPIEISCNCLLPNCGLFSVMLWLLPSYCNSSLSTLSRVNMGCNKTAKWFVL